MLESNVNELDKDFMIYYSEYVEHQYDNINILSKLISLGQLNALQFYYSIDRAPMSYKVGDNPNIDKIAKALEWKWPFPNYNEMFALASYYFNLTEDELNPIIHNLLALDPNHKFNIKKANEDIQNYKKNNKGYKWLNEAIKKANKVNNDCPNILLESLISEMKLSSKLYAGVFAYAIQTNHHSLFAKNQIKEELNDCINIKNKLKEEFKKDPSNEILAFTLAKNIIALNRFNSASQSDLNLANKILQKIAQKEYSGLIKTNTR